MKKKKTILLYTLLFMMMSLFLASIFFVAKKSYVWSEDGFKQHFLILYDFNQMLREFIKHPSIFPEFSLSIGLGEGMIGQYAYYILGDPFAYLSLLFSMNKLEFAYTILIYVRLYFAGISFMCYGYHKKWNEKNIIITSIIYTFSQFLIYSAVRHPYFINPTILLPILIICVDKVFEGKLKPLTIALIFTVITNFYFFYILTALIGIYALVKFFCEYKDKKIKYLFSIILKMILCYVIAILVSSIIFLPTLYTFLNCNRSGISTYGLYPPKYYYDLIKGLTMSDYTMSRWNVYGVSSIIILMFPIFFSKRREHKTFFTYFLICILISISSKLGSIMNGFSYPSNRWMFGFSFILCYMIGVSLDFDFKYDKKQIRNMALSVLVYSIIIFLIGPWDRELKVTILLMILMLTTFIFKNKLVKQWLLTSFILLNIASCIFFRFGRSTTYKYVLEFKNKGEVLSSYDKNGNSNSHFKDAISKIKEDKSLYRISKNPLGLQNWALYHDVYGLSSFFSLGTKEEAMLSWDLNNREYSISRYINELDNRSKITTLLGTKYFITTKGTKTKVPYGYELYYKKKDTLVFKNNYALGLGTFYKKVISEDEYEKLDELEKEGMLLKAAVLEDTNLEKIEHQTFYRKVSYKIDDKYKKEVKVTNIEDMIPIQVSNISNSEIYFSIKNIDFKPEKEEHYKNPNNYNVFISNEDKVKKELVRVEGSNAYYFPNKDILINMGYYDSYEGTFYLSFDSLGTYSYDDIVIYAVSFDDYKEDIEALRKYGDIIDTYNKNTFMGHIENEEDGIFQLSVPYSSGFSIYVDGKKVKSLRVNKYFVGCYLEKGRHDIKIVYHTPLLKIGILSSIIGLVSFIILTLKERKRCIHG